METKANYALIGTFVLLVFGAAVAFVAWLSNADFDQQYQEYEVVFTGAVRGLAQGGDVRFNGLRVGEVTRLSLDPGDSNIVIAAIEVDAATPVHTNSYARLEPQGLTGLSYIQIFAGGDDFPLFTELDDAREPFQIPGELDAISGIIEGGGSVLDQTQRALARVNATLSEEAIADLQSILSNVNTVTGKLAEAELDSEAISGALTSLTQAADEIIKTARSYDALAGDVRVVLADDIRPMLARLDTTLTEVDQVLASTNTTMSGASVAIAEGELLVVDAREAINRLSNSGLTDLEETTDSLRQLVGTLNRIAVQLERSPTEFIVGAKRTTVEIPQ